MASSLNPLLHLSVPAFASRRSSLPIPSHHRSFPICTASIGFNVQIAVEEDESEEMLLRRFKREVSKAGIIQEFRRRSHFENKQEEAKRRKQEAGRRNRRRKGGFRFTPTQSTDDAPKAKEDDDNWDMPEGNIPY